MQLIKKQQKRFFQIFSPNSELERSEFQERMKKIIHDAKFRLQRDEDALSDISRIQSTI